MKDGIRASRNKWTTFQLENTLAHHFLDDMLPSLPPKKNPSPEDSKKITLDSHKLKQ